MSVPVSFDQFLQTEVHLHSVNTPFPADDHAWSLSEHSRVKINPPTCHWMEISLNFCQRRKGRESKWNNSWKENKFQFESVKSENEIPLKWQMNRSRMSSWVHGSASNVLVIKVPAQIYGSNSKPLPFSHPDKRLCILTPSNTSTGAESSPAT